MFLDSASAVVAVGLAALGFFVTTRPPKTPKAKTLYEGAFGLLGILAVVLVILQGSRSDRLREASDRERKASEVREQQLIRIAVDADANAKNARDETASLHKEATADRDEARRDREEARQARRDERAAKTELERLISTTAVETTKSVEGSVGQFVKNTGSAVGRLLSPPRRIPETDRATYIQHLSSQKGSAVVQSPFNDREALQLADDIRAVLTSSGWTVRRGEYLGGVAVGYDIVLRLRCEVTGDKATLVGPQAVLANILEAYLKLNVIIDPIKTTDGVIEVNVQTRP